ncbi:NAD(P)-binding protein [Serendipita vermifera]|nr:NAD(P)-binding protein [Serendipita vermifera]
MFSGIVEVLGDTLYYKWWKNLPETTKDLTGRNVIVTGANTGVGLEAARFFYNMNPARLVLAVRNQDKGEAAKRDIMSQSKGAIDTKVEVWELDLCSFESVKRFASKCSAELERLDILMENAALGLGPWSTTGDGWESLLQVNVLSTFMLAALLAPLLQKTAKLPHPKSSVALKPHLVFASSDSFVFSQFPQRNSPTILAALNDKTQFTSDQYSVTKLLGIMLTRRLASSSIWSSDGHSKDDVVICCVNPAFCRSNILKNAPAAARWVVEAIFAKHPSEGAKNYTWACLNDDIPSGVYISMCKVANTFGFVDTEDALRIGEKVWDEMASVIIKMAPETESVWKISK